MLRSQRICRKFSPRIVFYYKEMRIMGNFEVFRFTDQKILI